jgi:hypothetical protein
VRHSPALAATVALVLAAPTVGWAQASPDLSGIWLLMEPAAAERRQPLPDGFVAGGGQDGFHPRVIIRQTPTELAIEGYAFHQNPQIVVYQLNGSETTSTGSAGTTKATAGWDAGKLAIAARRTYSSPLGDISIDSKEVYSLVDGVLTLDRTENTQAGSTRKRAKYSKAKS